jgi:hypothetical protein
MVALISWLHHDASAHTSYLFIVKDLPPCGGDNNGLSPLRQHTKQNRGYTLSDRRAGRPTKWNLHPGAGRAAHYTPTGISVNVLCIQTPTRMPGEGAL